MINGNCVETTNQMMMMLMMMIIIIITIIIIYYDILLSPWWWWYTNCVITIGMIIIPAGIFRADWVEGKISTFGPPALGATWRWRTWFPKSIVLKEIRWDCHDVGGGESDDKDDDDHNTTDSDLTMNIYITMRITIRTTIRTTMIVVYYNHYQRTALLWQ